MNCPRKVKKAATDTERPEPDPRGSEMSLLDILIERNPDRAERTLARVKRARKKDVREPAVTLS